MRIALAVPLVLAGGALIWLTGCSGDAEATRPRSAGVPPASSPGPTDPSPPEAARPATFAFSGELQQGGWVRGVSPGGTRSLTLDGAALALGAGGAFFAAFDRDAAPASRLEARLGDGRTVVQTLAIAPRAWQIERVNIARREGGATEEFMAIRRPELARIAAARAMRTDAAGWRQDFIWPVRGRISGRFGSQRIYRGEPGSYHSGIDVSTGTSGTPFVAPADGVVILAAERPFTLEGNLLMLDHGMGLNSAFLHCSQLLVRAGDHVKQGQVIGTIGSTGRATGPHLHWSLKWREARIDPILFTGPMN